MKAVHRGTCPRCGGSVEVGEEIERHGEDEWAHSGCPMVPSRAMSPAPPPQTAAPVSGDRPAWCGSCDARTRLIDHGDHVTRCRTCWPWPEKGTYPRQPLPQHKVCGGCGRTVYAWDAMPCGSHTDVTARRSPAPQEAHGPVLTAEPRELSTLGIAELSAELKALREWQASPRPPDSAERSAALRRLASGQAATSRARRLVI